METPKDFSKERGEVPGLPAYEITIEKLPNNEESLVSIGGIIDEIKEDSSMTPAELLDWVRGFEEALGVDADRQLRAIVIHITSGNMVMYSLFPALRRVELESEGRLIRKMNPTRIDDNEEPISIPQGSTLLGHLQVLTKNEEAKKLSATDDQRILKTFRQYLDLRF